MKNQRISTDELSIEADLKIVDARTLRRYGVDLENFEADEFILKRHKEFIELIPF